MPSTPSTTTSTSRVLVATRIHGQETTAATPFDGAKLRAFLRSAVGYADAVAVAVEVADVFHPNLLVAVQDVAKEFGDCAIDVLPVTPWGRFVPALNAALAFALQRDFSHILFLSLEMDLTPPAFRALFANFDPADDLVVGAGTCLERDDGEGRESTLKLAASYQLISSPLFPSFPLPYKTSLGRPPFPTWPSPLDRYHYPLEHLRALVRPQVEPFGLLGRLGRAHAGQGSRGRGGGGCHCLSPAMLATASFGVVDVEFFVSME
jgi:hypothetical protein